MPGKNTTGQAIESYCTKCKVNRDHTIMVMVEEVIGKVRCKTCGGSHKYRDPLVAHKVWKAGRKKAAAEETTAAVVWETGMAEAKGKVRNYSMTEKYRVGDIVDHKTFGKGIVTKLYFHKCDMLFKDRERLMASTNA